MTLAVEERGYETVHDPAQLRTAIRELRRVRAWLRQFADLAAEMPGFAPEHVVAAKASTSAVVDLLLGRARTRLQALTARQQPPGIVLLDPERGRIVDAGGLAVLPMVTEPAVATRGLSSAVLRLDPGRTTAPHVHPDHDAILIVIFGALDLTWWDASGGLHHLTHRRHQHAHVRRGTRHILANSGAVQAVAVQVQATAELALHAVPDHER